MYKLLIVLFVLLSSCINFTEEQVRIQEYGDYYASMDCWWGTGTNFIVFCRENLDTELIYGDVIFQIVKDINEETYFKICGKNVILNSGYELQDYYIEILTEDRTACYDFYETELGNKFDAIWDPEKSVLQLIWRPENQLHKALTLYIPPSDEVITSYSGNSSPPVIGILYYKTGMFD